MLLPPSFIVYTSQTEHRSPFMIKWILEFWRTILKYNVSIYLCDWAFVQWWCGSGEQRIQGQEGPHQKVTRWEVCILASGSLRVALFWQIVYDLRTDQLIQWLPLRIVNNLFCQIQQSCFCQMNPILLHFPIILFSMDLSCHCKCLGTPSHTWHHSEVKTIRTYRE